MLFIFLFFVINHINHHVPPILLPCVRGSTESEHHQMGMCGLRCIPALITEGIRMQHLSVVQLRILRRKEDETRSDLARLTWASQL